MIDHIEVRGANVNNLKNIDVDIPLNKFVAISGPSGSGKSSLAMGILYSEGSKRYLDALSAYTKNRIGQAKSAQVRSVKHIPAALALRQRPSIPSERSTVGSISEILNVVRLIFSRLGSVVCPNGDRLKPSMAVAKAMAMPGDKMGQMVCPVCGVVFMAKSAEDFSFNSTGACQECHGLGRVRQLDPDKLIADDTKTVAEGAVASWRLPGRNFMPTVAQSIGVRIDVPYKDLTDREKNIILHGEKKQYQVDFRTSTGRVFHADKALYENAYDAVYESVKSSTSERSVARLNSFFHFSTCPVCHGTRLNPELLTQLVAGLTIVQVENLTLSQLPQWAEKTQSELPESMQKMAAALFRDLKDHLQPLLELGLDYLTLSRAGNSLSTGELQRIELARTLRTETTGVLYILDEPSIGLHPDNIRGLIHVMRVLIAQGNSLVVVDHESSIIAAADWVIEIGPGSGEAGGQVIAQGTPLSLTHNPASLIGPYISGQAQIMQPKSPLLPDASKIRETHLAVSDYFNLHNVAIAFPNNQLTAVTGFSGAGKTSLILSSLVKAIQARKQGQKPPRQVSTLTTDLRDVISVDSSPVGKNGRSTLATYTSIMDNLRRIFASLPEAQAKHYGISYFSYNSKEGGCPHCGGSGTITLDVQYLPDIEEACPYCHGTRFISDVQRIRWQGYSIVDLLNLSVKEALPVFKSESAIEHQLQLLAEVGLSYLHLGESTPSLSGGEAQRLKLAKHLARGQKGTLFVFDEPSIGLHPQDVQVLLGVLSKLKESGATIIVITHDLNIMINADYLIDLGPKGGSQGGRVMASGRPLELIKQANSITLTYLKKHADLFHVSSEV